MLIVWDISSVEITNFIKENVDSLRVWDISWVGITNFIKENVNSLGYILGRNNEFYKGECL